MDLSNTYDTKRNSIDRTVAFLVSLICHTLVLLCLACWVFVHGSLPNGPVSVSFIAESERTMASVDLRIEPVEVPSEAVEAKTASTDQGFEFDFDPQFHGTALDSTSANASLTSLALKAVDASEVLSDGQEKGKGATFFGSYADGERFVYVLDSSKSMEGKRWLLARWKLLESLKGLSSDQEFFVICFDAQTTLMFNEVPQKAAFTRANLETQRRLTRWLNSRVLGEATMPAEALAFALSMRPDAIFILSDGELMDNTVQMLRVINLDGPRGNKIPIHAVHMFSQAGRQTLQQLSRDNNGTFTFVADGNGDF
ncbi:MAG TPA: hypothetical protein DCF63_14835 [Planctomycetaceae bacterium]|nr:hypothetical protein [Planctomycetaceae bacterium]